MNEIRIGIIGLGLMGRELASAAARWCHFTDDIPKPVIKGICDKNLEGTAGWFNKNFKDIEVVSDDYKEFVKSEKIDVLYCAVPHVLHADVFTAAIQAGKHLLAEKPFGMDKIACDKIIKAMDENPEVIVKCSSEFPYFPAVKYLIEWLQNKAYGRLIEVKSGFHHSSDMDLKKPINWKRMVDINGEYGCMGDLGIHTQHIPFRMGWKPKNVFADLSNIAETRPDGKGNEVPCETWDNAILTCKCDDPDSGKEFSLILETKRMQPGATNTWFLEVYGTDASIKFSTQDPKSIFYLKTQGKEQGWTRLDLGSQSFLPTITGGIFEFGFSDAFQQMIGAFMLEVSGEKAPFGTFTPEEAVLSHKLLTAALNSHKSGRKIEL